MTISPRLFVSSVARATRRGALLVTLEGAGSSAAALAAARPLTLSLPLAQLRDACGCGECRDARTGQRRADTLAAPAAARRAAATPQGELAVEWRDAHASVFGARELRALARSGEGEGGGDGGRGGDAASGAAASRVVWTAATLPRSAVAHAEWMASDAALLRGLRALRDCGFVRVEGVPPSEAGTAAALRRIAPPMRTIYGEGAWRTEVLAVGDARNTDGAFGRAALPLHTDGCYMREPPGLQAFHALRADAGGGGASLLADGAAVAASVRAASAGAWRLLSDEGRLRVAYAHVDAEHELRAERGVFAVGARGEFRAVCFNDADRVGAPLLGRGASAAAALAALRVLNAALRDERLVARFVLEPGTLLVFDNSRVLHGREAIAGAGRVLAGAYISADDWRSRLRMLERSSAEGGAEEE